MTNKDLADLAFVVKHADRWPFIRQALNGFILSLVLVLGG